MDERRDATAADAAVDSEHVRRLLSAAAEPDGDSGDRAGPPRQRTTPGPDLLVRARRSLRRRRAALAAGTAAALAAVAFAGTTTVNTFRDEAAPTPASASCVEQAAADLRGWVDKGYQPLHVTVGDDKRIPMDNGTTQGFGFRATAKSSLTDTRPPGGRLSVWNPLHPEGLPDSTELVLLLRQARVQPEAGARPYYDVAPRPAYPVSADGKVTLPCQDGDGAADLQRLRHALGQR
ncbi:hypothetical protein G5C51_32220 [Streptomyces sp. A7024]|uniref:Uncharacterized protein n=1 Tax=Streptomyces coryli TaxID=1128680 RepID=A0A6G4UBI3_9ACTN|nr:hypothetical protein [Streptomyces coryli]NGN68551.1 hypothetical protein [Streptomyces coryli]